MLAISWLEWNILRIQSIILWMLVLMMESSLPASLWLCACVPSSVSKLQLLADFTVRRNSTWFLLNGRAWSATMVWLPCRGCGIDCSIVDLLRRLSDHHWWGLYHSSRKHGWLWVHPTLSAINGILSRQVCLRVISMLNMRAAPRLLHD